MSLSAKFEKVHRTLFSVVLGCFVLGLAPSLWAQAAADAAVAKIHKQYVEGYTTKILAPFETKVSALEAKFSKALLKEHERATRSGDLDHVLAAKQHMEAVQEGRGLPENTGDLSENLLALRKIYSTQYAELVESHQARTRPLLKQIDAKFAKLQRNFTTKGLVDDALRIRQERERLKTDGLAFLPLPKGVPAVVPRVRKAPPPKVAAPPLIRAPLKNPYHIDFRKLRRGSARCMTQTGMKVTEEPPPGGGDADRAVRVFSTGHWAHYVTRKGKLVGYFQPAEKGNKKIVQVALGYRTPMVLHEDGRVSFAERLEALPAGLDPDSLEGAISLASNDHVAVILFADGRLVAWSHPRDKPPKLIELNKVPNDLTTLWATRDVIIGRRATGGYVVVHAVRDGSEFEEKLNMSKFQTLDASPSSSVVLGIKENGQVVALSSGGSAPPEVPGDLENVIQVRTGDEVLAAQLKDGSWKAWGKFKAQALIDRINEFSRPVYDISIAGKRVMWVE